MADNITVDNVDLTDYVVATDDDGTAQHQYVKIEFGADNTQTKVSAANPLPVTGTALSGTVAVSSIASGVNTLGTVVIGGVLPAGTNTLGTIAVSALPTLPAGVNTLGTIVVSSIASGVNTLGTVAISVLPAGTNTIGTVARVGATPAGANTIGTVALVGALPAGTNTLGTIASITGPLPAGVNTLGTVAPIGTFTTKETRSSTGTMSHVASSSSAVGLLNVNANRLGFSVQNDATGNLYIGYGSQVSTIDYVARLTQYAYFEVPFNYTGTVCGFWSTVVASDGGARITEYS